MSQIVTFYSYKGGVGRSMALANVAVLLSNWGYKTLIIDWDLEAPGIENYFSKFISLKEVYKKEGLIELLLNYDKMSWKDIVIPISSNHDADAIHLISAGKRDRNYFEKIRKFDIDSFYNEEEGGYKLEEFRAELKENYDFILIDSRTGITDNGGICTIQFPDINVLLFTSTEQGFNGILDVAKKSQKVHQNLPFERQKLISIPIPSRFDTQTEFKISQQWINKFAKGLKPIYDDWLPTFIKRKQLIEITKIPYVPYFSFGEKLPVLEQGVHDPTGLGYSYETLASILANNVQNIESLINDREEYIERAYKNKDAVKFNKEENQLDEINIFISYAHKDRKLKNQLKSYLSVLNNKYKIKIWDDDALVPGMKWEEVIKENIAECDIALVLISPDYVANEWITGVEFLELLEQDKIIIPIKLRDTALLGTNVSIISSYQALPRDFKPIEEAKNIDEKFNEIVKGVKSSIEYFLDNKPSKQTKT